MGLIREALRAPRLDGQRQDAEACAIRMIDGNAIGVAVPYGTVARLIFGNRPLAGPPRGLRIDEKRGWLELSPPACDPEDEGLIPLTAISAILPLYPEDIEAELEAEPAIAGIPEGADSNGNGQVPDDPDYR